MTETDKIEVPVSTDFTSYANGICEGSDMHFMLDSGSTISFISEETKCKFPLWKNDK